MRIFAIQGNTNYDMGFAVIVKNDEDYDRAKKLALIGWDAWWYATNPEDWENNEYFSKEDVESFYDMGYVEPASILLDRESISYEIKTCFDKHGDLLPEFKEKTIEEIL